MKDPQRLVAIVGNHQHVIIDEVQKIADLLDVVHLLMEDKKVRFILTGSSARKLKKSNVNMLAGRAINAKMFPLTIHELKEKFDF